MPRFVVETPELKSGVGRGKVRELAEFLEKRLGTEVEATENQIVLELEGLSRQYLRVLLRKFLHQHDLKEEFRVISGGESVLIVKGRRRAAAEE